MTLQQASDFVVDTNVLPDADSTEAYVRLSPSAHIYPAGSVAVLINRETTPSQLHITPVSTEVRPGRGILRTYCYLLDGQ